MFKIIKDNPQILYKKSFAKEIIFNRHYDYEEVFDLIQNTKAYLKDPIKFYKNQKGDTTTVALIKYNQRKFVIKQYNFRNLKHKLKLQFRKSHGFRSFAYSYFLSLCDFPTIKPVAAIQNRKGFLKGDSYFISEYEEGVPGCVYFKEGSTFRKDWPITVKQILRMIQKMRDNFIYHGDFHCGNLVIVDGKPLLLDFDRIQIMSKNKFPTFHLKDMTNFKRYLIANENAYLLFKELSAEF